MPPPSPETPSDPTPERPLRTALVDSSLAVLLALALFAAPVAGRLLVGGDGLPPRWRLGADTTAWELAIPRDEAQAMVDELRAQAPPQVDVTLEESGGALWLELVAPPDVEELPAVDEALGARSAWTGQIRTEPGFARILSRSLRAPGEAAAAFPLLVPWMFASTGLAFLVAGWLGRRRRPEPRWGPAPGGALGRVGLGLGAGALLVLLTEGLSRLLAALGLAPAEQGLVVAVVEAGGFTLGAFAALAVLLAPPAEELFFRGHVFRFLAPRVPRWQAHALSALLFAGVHLNPVALPLYVVYGLGLSLLYERSRSLLVPVLAHGVVNATAVAQLTLG